MSKTNMRCETCHEHERAFLAAIRTGVDLREQNEALRTRVEELEKSDEDLVQLTQLMELMIEHKVTPDGEKWAKLARLLREGDKYKSQLEWMKRKEAGWL